MRLASERISGDDATRIHAVLDLERRLNFDSIETGQAHDFHILLAALTGNAAMRLFVEILTGLTYERSGRTRIDPASLDQMHAAHDAIAKAVISGDADLAERRMAKHLSAIARYYVRRERDGN